MSKCRSNIKGSCPICSLGLVDIGFTISDKQGGTTMQLYRYFEGGQLFFALQQRFLLLQRLKLNPGSLAIRKRRRLHWVPAWQQLLCCFGYRHRHGSRRRRRNIAANRCAKFWRECGEYFDWLMDGQCTLHSHNSSIQSCISRYTGKSVPSNERLCGKCKLEQKL